MDWSIITGIIKNVKHIFVLLLGFSIFVYFTNPEALGQFIELILGNGYGATGLIIVGLIVNYIKVNYPEILPRIAE